jgi:hypothetical protein
LFAAAADNGSFVTEPLRWNGGELSINADTVETGDTTASAVQISIVYEGRHWTPSSLPFHGNETNATVEWSAAGMNLMASATGRVIQLEVVLTGAARLYSLRGNFAWQ